MFGNTQGRLRKPSWRKGKRTTTMHVWSEEFDSKMANRPTCPA